MKKLNLLPIVYLLLVVFITSCKVDDNDPTGKGKNSPPIVLDNTFFEEEQTLTHTKDKPVDYYINDLIYLEKPLVIEAGTVIEFGPDAGFDITDQGSINSKGTTSAWVTLRGKKVEKGYWRGILFNTNSSQNKLHFTNVNQAGSTTFNSNGDQAAIIIWGNAKLDLFKCHITDSGKDGISAIHANSNFKISETSIYQCINMPLIINVNYLDFLDGTNHLSGANNYILTKLNISNLTTDVTLYNEGAPYRFSSYASYAPNLTIENCAFTVMQGARILFEEGVGVNVNSSASFNAIGTDIDKIAFEGFNENTASWKGITFLGTQSSNNIIKNAKIYYSGTDFNGLKGGIMMKNNPKITLENVVFGDIDGCGVFNDDTQDNPNLTTINISEIICDGLICRN